jgi:hypothetical protein
MKALLLFGFLAFSGWTLTSSITKNNLLSLSSDETFVKSVALISTLPSLTTAQFDDRVKKIESAYVDLKKKYVELNKSATADAMINSAIDKLAKDGKLGGNVDPCLTQLIHDVLKCFSSCLGHDALKTCLAAACASYQICKNPR